MKYTTLDNGDIVFPHRGEPPTLGPSWTQDPGDKYLFHPTFPKCRFRISLLETLPCGKKQGPIWRCELIGQTVSVPHCKGCLVREEPTGESS